ncbi:MAG TPA: hypothetical protein PK095_00565, partial [Myxococcota bacterium]|nr:hypothetical protein [Myxococcota bacterium]
IVTIGQDILESADLIDLSDLVDLVDLDLTLLDLLERPGVTVGPIDLAWQGGLETPAQHPHETEHRNPPGLP